MVRADGRLVGRADWQGQGEHDAHAAIRLAGCHVAYRSRCRCHEANDGIGRGQHIGRADALEVLAIASVLSELVGESGPSISCADVNNWLMKRGGEPRFFDHDQALPYGHADWRLRVHGAKVLDSIFFDLTKDFGAHEYQKVKHGLLLTRYLVSHPTDDLKRLSDFLSGILESGDGDN